jgi:excinuclease UvrABC nuclease subunit
VLAHALEFVPARDAEIFAAAPAAPAVFLLRGPEGEPYVSKTTNLRRRLMRLLSAPTERSKRLNLRERATTIEYTPTGSDFESGFLLYQVLRQTFPEKYRERLRLRFAPLVKLHLENRYPRASITTRLGRNAAQYYGPFPTRAAAEKFSNDALDFFKMRRCVDDLNPDPAFPGCIYSEMKMCLAPCFKGCTDEQYAAEVARVQAFFDSGGQSLVRELAAQREQASANLQFEEAAAIHARLEKLQPVLSQLPEIVHRLDQLRGLVIQPSEAESVALFRIEAGRLGEPVNFAIAAKQEAGKIHSMEGRLQEALATAPPLAPVSAMETMEHLALLKRWYYRTSKVGEAFFAGEKGELPWRRIVRGVSRVFRGEKPAADLSESTRDYWVNRGKAAQLNPEDYNV